MTYPVTNVLKLVAHGGTLDACTAEQFMNALMDGEITPVQTAGLLAAMAVRGETVAEIVGFARAMRNHSLQLKTPLNVVDTCGTGGDGGNTFNISTAAAVVCASAGVPVAKHGNRAVSSRSGSADVLAALGSRIDLEPEEALSCLTDVGLCFLFAQQYHPAMKHAAEPRSQLGFRTIFNILGPLTNPAGARRQVIGVYREDLVEKVAYALADLGTEHALVVYGAGGIDEFSLQGENVVAEVRGVDVSTYRVDGTDFGLRRAPVSRLAGGDADTNARIIRDVFSGRQGPARDVIVLNAGAVLYVSGAVTTFADGVRQASEHITTGDALVTLNRYVEATKRVIPAEVAR